MLHRVILAGLSTYVLAPTSVVFGQSAKRHTVRIFGLLLALGCAVGVAQAQSYPPQSRGHEDFGGGHALEDAAIYIGFAIMKDYDVEDIDEFLSGIGTNHFKDWGDPLGVGGVVGYNFRPWNNNIVVGPFASFDYLRVKTYHTFPAGTFLGSTTHWMANVGAKVGAITAPGTFLYGLVGAAWLNEDLNTNVGGPNTPHNTTVPGFTLGLGAEYELSAWQKSLRWPVSVFIQYQHTWWGTAHLDNPTGSPGFNYTFKREDNTIKVGLNFALSGPTSPPPRRAIISK